MMDDDLRDFIQKSFTNCYSAEAVAELYAELLCEIKLQLRLNLENYEYKV